MDAPNYPHRAEELRTPIATQGRLERVAVPCATLQALADALKDEARAGAVADALRVIADTWPSVTSSSDDAGTGQ